MKRRTFITLLGGAAVAWPRFVRAQQQPAMPVIGFLHGASPASYAPTLTAFGRGLKETGYIEGQNVAIEFRWAHNDRERLPALAAELVARRVNVITAGPLSAAMAAKASTTTIPVVFTSGGDPVEFGLVTSLNRPGGNVTGVSQYATALAPKRLELLRELAPKAALVAVLVRPSVSSGSMVQELRAAAFAVGQNIRVFNVGNIHEIDSVFATIVASRANALLLSPDPMFTSRRVQITTLATRHALPTMYVSRDFAEAGGLMSYGANIEDVFRQAGVYVGRILKGEKPAELPVMLPTKFELVINLNTAKALGLDVPPTLLARADEVIE
jgi:putative ABC transport system substrate-binding protein